MMGNLLCMSIESLWISLLNSFWNVQKTRCPRRDIYFITNLPWLLFQPSMFLFDWQVFSLDLHLILFQLRLDVKNSTAEVRLYIPGTPLDPPSPVLLPYPIVLIPREKSVYFVPPETFNLVAMMSNPMMLLMVVGGGMMLAMPYLMVGSVFPFRICLPFRSRQST